MSSDASANFIASFEAMVKHAYQGGMKLRGAVRVKTGVQGSTHRFNTMGKGLATPRVPQTDVVPMNIDHGYQTATLTDWNAPEYSDKFDLSKMPFDERTELASIVANAIGRRADQLVIDAMATSASSTQISEDLGGTNSVANTTKLRRASRLMNAAGVPQGDRYIAHNALFLEGLLSSTDVTSADYNTVRALVNGQIDSFMGFKFIMIEDRTEGGIPLSTANIRNNFAFHKDSVGLAIGMDMRVENNYIAEKTSWLVNGLFSAGAVTIDTNGVYDLLTYEA
jgi:hypothetical protein